MRLAKRSVCLSCGFGLGLLKFTYRYARVTPWTDSRRTDAVNMILHVCVCVSATDSFPLTVKSVLLVVKEVHKSKWREWNDTTQSDQSATTHSDNDEDTDGEDDPDIDKFDFRDALEIPAEEMKSIAKEYSTLDDRICAGIKWWVTSSQASWRKLLWALDAVQESKVADSIRDHAEDPTG